MGFGGDSAIELLSAIVVLWRFRSKSDAARSERIAARTTGVLLVLLALLVTVAAGLALLGYREPQPSLVGIILLVVAAFSMPWLARRKRRLAAQFGSAALRADATESAVCAFMSWITLAGLLSNEILRKSWADPVAALVLVPLMLSEGWKAVRESEPGRQCCSLEPR